MADDSGDTTIVKIAVFGISVSFMCSILIGVLILDDGSDYNYDDIQSYRDDLGNFTGESMINTTPWVLTHVYTPWQSNYGVSANNVDDDGWLFGEEITDYEYLNMSAYIALDPTQKSNIPISVDSEDYSYTESHVKWWAHNGLIQGLYQFFNNETYKNTTTIEVNNWDYTGYRYVFDPTLPFSDSDDSGKTSTRDGALSIVWYNYNGSEGLSGGLDVYGGSVKLASYSATDIISDYNTASGYATSYDFDFEGTHLTLSILFDTTEISAGTPLMQAWTQGSWTMAVSSVSAGNFFDIDSSTSFTATAGNMIQTFINIFTFSVPSIDNIWMDTILWLIVALPMMIALLLITLRLVNGFRVL